jgi:hypothetical protein
MNPVKDSTLLKLRTARTYKSCKTSAYLEWSAKYLTHSHKA